MTVLSACYELARQPPSFDIVTFLCQAERERRRRGAEAIDLTITPGPVGGFRRDTFWPYTLPERQALLDQVALPLCKMLPSVRTVTQPGAASVPDGAFVSGHMLAQFVEAYREGVRPLRPLLRRALLRNIVTITLREAEHWPERNSAVKEWCTVARELQRRGFHVIVVRDTRFADAPLEDLPCAPSEARSLHARATLYHGACVNLGLSNGPLWMALAMNAPVLMLKPVTEALMATCSAEYFAAAGIPPGGQIPGAPVHQRLVWEDDRAEAILAAFDAFMWAQPR